jgi:hypothetical protein
VGGFHGADGFRPDRQDAFVYDLFQDREPLSGFSEQGIGAEVYIGKSDLRRGANRRV